MKLLLIFSLLLTTLGLCHAGLETIKDIITDPVISRRCKGLLQERSEKLQVQQKLNSMYSQQRKINAAKHGTDDPRLKRTLELNTKQDLSNIRKHLKEIR